MTTAAECRREELRRRLVIRLLARRLGGKAAAGRRLGVHKSQVSRWTRGGYVPLMAVNFAEHLLADLGPMPP